MKQLRHYIILALLFMGFCASGGDIKDFEKHFKLMPQPQKIELLTGQGLTATSLRSIFLQGTDICCVLPFLTFKI